MSYIPDGDDKWRSFPQKHLKNPQTTSNGLGISCPNSKLTSIPPNLEAVWKHADQP